MRRSALTILITAGLAGCAVAPESLSDADITRFADDKLVRVTAAQEPLTGAVSLYEAMARALKYNLDKRVREMEVALRQRQLRVAHYSMLPELAANAGYADRDNYSGGSSVELV